MVHGHSNDARFEPQEWFERHLEDRGGEVTELIYALAPVALHKRETVVGVHLAIATTFAAVLAALGLRQLGTRSDPVQAWTGTIDFERGLGRFGAVELRKQSVYAAPLGPSRWRGGRSA